MNTSSEGSGVQNALPLLFGCALYHLWRAFPNLNGTIDTKVVPFFYTHKIPKIRTFCYEKKHLKNGFPFLWRAENKQRNE